MRRTYLIPVLTCLALLATVAPAQAQRRTVMGSNTIINAPGGNIVLPTSMMKGAQFVSTAQIRAQDLANHSKAANEVHTYLANPAAWQKNVMDPIHFYELGLPSFKLKLSNGVIIDEWAMPKTFPPGTKDIHYFTLGPGEVPASDKTKTWYSKSAVIQVWTPPGIPLPQAIPNTSFQGFK